MPLLAHILTRPGRALRYKSSPLRYASFAALWAFHFNRSCSVFPKGYHRFASSLQDSYELRGVSMDCQGVKGRFDACTIHRDNVKVIDQSRLNWYAEDVPFREEYWKENFSEKR